MMVLTVAPAVAGFHEGEAAYARGDYRAALTEWRPLAERGDRRAQRRVAEIYRDGKGVWKDFEQAAAWFRLAAAQGDPEAQYSLGYIQFAGLVFPRDLDEMLRWLMTAAAHGHGEAQITLGAVHEYGLESLPRDRAQALKWYRLATMNVTGPRRELVLRAVERVAAKMSPAEIVEAERMIDAWKPAAD